MDGRETIDRAFDSPVTSGNAGEHARMGAVMTLDQATDLLRQSLIMALLISAPMLCIGLIVGVIVSLFQAVTQIQEQTLSFIPKVLALAGVLVVGGPWMLNQLVSYTQDLWLSIPQMVGA